MLWIGRVLGANQIAERLKISGDTVRAHRKSIAAKLGARSAELMVRAGKLDQRMAGGMAPGE